ncbi:MAG: MoaD/ThiS family protein [Haloferacaceae archaeon]
MEVEVRTYGDVRSAVGERTLTLDLPADATVADALAALASDSDLTIPDGSDADALLVVRNGRNVALDEGRATRLAPGDRLSLSGSPMPE